MDFNGKIALVTGSTSGIGFEIAKQLLLNGSKVIINYSSNNDQKEETKKLLNEYSDNMHFIKADISNEQEVKDMFIEISDKYGTLDYLVNNAGTNIDSYIENFNIDDCKKVIYVNLIVSVICTKYAIPLLKKSMSASIVNIGSKLGIKPCSESSAYCASKAALINFTQATALELSSYKIRANIVNPGFTPTPLSLSSWTKEEIEEKKRTNPLGRLGMPIDTANMVMFLLSDKAEFITGEVINVNGGSLLK